MFIKPGEFSFCSRCGNENTCRFGSENHQCEKCKPSSGMEKNAIVDAQEKIGAINYAFRQRLSALRSQFLPPLFWMPDVIKERQLREKVVDMHANARLKNGIKLELDAYQLRVFVKEIQNIKIDGSAIKDMEIESRVNCIKDKK